MKDGQIKQIEEAMAQLGFTRISDYSDMSGCAPPINGTILQFFNPKTMEGIQVSIGNYNEESMFGEDFQQECDELLNKTLKEPVQVTAVDKTYFELVEDSSGCATDEPFEADDLEDAQARILEGMGYRVRPAWDDEENEVP